MDEFVETLFESYWKVNSDGEYMSIADCGSYLECKVAEGLPNWSIVVECNCFRFRCREFIYCKKGSIIYVGGESPSLYLDQMQIVDLRIYMEDC